MSVIAHRGILVVQHPHLVRRHQLTARKLEVSGVVLVHTPAPAVGIHVDGLLAQELGNVLMRGLLIAAEIEETLSFVAFYECLIWPLKMTAIHCAATVSGIWSVLCP